MSQPQYLWMQMSKLGYRLSEPLSLNVPIEKPTLIQETVNMHLTSLYYTADELKNILYLNDEEYKRFDSTQSPTMRIVSKVYKLNPNQNYKMIRIYKESLFRLS